MGEIPPREAFAAVTRQAIGAHREWDSPHCFQTLVRDGEKLRARTYECIMPDIRPAQYPALMMRLAGEDLDRHPGEPACGYLFQGEFHGAAEPLPAAGEAERERYERARIAGTFHELDYSVEAAVAWCADIRGRLWSAAKTRRQPDQVTERFYPPLFSARPAGRLVSALLGVAMATGVTAWGLPGPQGPLSSN